MDALYRHIYKQFDKSMKYKTLFISDTHFGTADSKTHDLLQFLKLHTFEKVYLVGDIIDFWAIKAKSTKYWSHSTNAVIRKIIKISKHAPVIYITGNHDDALEAFIGESFGNIIIKDQDIHYTKNNKKVLVIHGHSFDAVIKYAKWLAIIGSRAYAISLWLNRQFNKIRRFFGMRYWSLSAFLKFKVKSAVSFISKYEEYLIKTAKENNADIIVAGHIHHAELRQTDGIIYANCGDWVESKTAIVEKQNGEIELLKL